VTNDLAMRVYEHKSKENKGFTQKYNVNKLVYYEDFSNINEAIDREKQIKSGTRERKIGLINRLNPTWEDLYEDL
jgi:putative endonuclease